MTREREISGMTHRQWRPSPWMSTWGMGAGKAVQVGPG